ncbi:MAG: class I SAM-dependent methyltransferase [Acidobacteria bacterium]|nr:class I SAM-dependent methyltransferase [Acidobacteriota bacterium]
MAKATPQQIRERFDQDVERFSNLETGQTATIDAPLALELIAKAATGLNPDAGALLDIGCGAGNFTLKLLETLPNLDITLIDLSEPMLARARQRIGRPVTALHGDIRDLELGTERFDIVLAGAVLHHLRGEQEWRAVFQKIHASVKPGGSFWISDLVEHSTPAVQAIMWERYGQYLTALKGEDYRRHVFGYIAFEDTPRPLLFQVDLLRAVGFSQVEILHKNSCFAAFGAMK